MTIATTTINHKNISIQSLNVSLLFAYSRRELHNVLIKDSLESSRAISTHIKYPEEIGYENLFDAITYKKGASLIRMMDAFLTTDTLQKVCKTTEITII